MTNFEKFFFDKEKTIEFLDKYGDFDESPWMRWFAEKYCNKCDTLSVYVKARNGTSEACYCEVLNKCKFFKELNHTPTNKEIIEMWLDLEVK